MLILDMRPIDGITQYDCLFSLNFTETSSKAIFEKNFIMEGTNDVPRYSNKQNIFYKYSKINFMVI